jgi:hypothetical protein
VDLHPVLHLRGRKRRKRLGGRRKRRKRLGGRRKEKIK